MTYQDKIWIGRMKVLPFERSFASHPLFSFFSQELNSDVDPKQIAIRSGKNLYMKCPVCIHIYLCSPHQLNGCKFCTHQQLCDNDLCIICFSNSLASRHFKDLEDFKEFKRLLESSANDETIYDIFLKTCAIYDYNKNNICCRAVFKSSSKIQCWFICNKCNHSFSNTPSHVESLQDCPYCSPKNAKMLCSKDKDCQKCFVKSFASHPKSVCWDYSEGKNKGLSPCNVFKSGTHPADMICGECNMPFQSSCNNISTGYWCPFCKNKTERKLKEFLDTVSSLKFTYQYKPKWLYNSNTKGQRSFDFGELKIKLVFENDGDQHFYNKIHWGSTGEENLEKDIQKMLLAVNEGFSGIRIYQPDVLFDKCDWRKWGVDAFNYINTQSEPIWVFPKNSQYKRHIEECIARSIRYIVL